MMTISDVKLYFRLFLFKDDGFFRRQSHNAIYVDSQDNPIYLEN